MRITWPILLLPLIQALITLESIRELTRLTDDLRVKIEESVEGSGVAVEENELLGVGGSVGQRVLGLEVEGRKGDEDGDEDGDEVEDVIAASLKMLCSELLFELERSSSPISSFLRASLDLESEDLKCRVIKRGYHNFLQATAKFIQQVQDCELRWRWSHESTVFEGVGWLQGLWASRKTNTQDRSFIEQQMALYGDTNCFEKGKNEVLRSGVEVVEYLNDLLDLFP